jgi:hypothetical protein
MHHNFKKALPFEKQINAGWTAEHAYNQPAMKGKFE